jgi:citrate lyase subunit beta/citryl-CoA lyase
MTGPGPRIVWEEQPLRALLFAPANEARKAEGVGRFGADACVLDLEDAVALTQKDTARAAVAERVARYVDPSVLMVRVNSADSGLLDQDLDAACHPNVEAILIPKVEDPAALDHAHHRLGELEAARGVAVGQIRLLALVETTAGLVRCEEIARAASPRLLTLVFGLVDFSLDLGIDLSEDPFNQVLYARSRLVVAARAANLAPPVDGPYMRLDDAEGCALQAQRSRGLGFQGQVTVYPPQVEVVQRAYGAFTEEELAHARRVVKEFEHAQADGLAAVRVDEHFVDYPVYHRARRMLKVGEMTGGS